MAKKQPDINIPQHEIEALARCLLPEIQNSLKARRGRKNLKNGKLREQRKQKQKGKERMTKAAASFTIPPL